MTRKICKIASNGCKSEQNGYNNHYSVETADDISFAFAWIVVH